MIQSEADYAAFFHGNPPASPALDFTTEDVIALEMGEELSGGHAISVTRIARNGGAGADVTVSYSSQVPQAGAVVKELCAVSASCEAADVSTLPGTIDDPTPVLDLPAQRIVATVGGTAYTTDVTKSGLYDSYASRVGSLVDALQVVVDRIVRETDGELVSGTVVYPGASDLSIDGTTLAYDKVLAPLVAAYSGKTMSVRAQVRLSGPARVLAIEATARTRAHLRADASARARSLGIVRKGTPVEVVGSRGRYLEVNVAGVTGWIYEPYVILTD